MTPPPTPTPLPPWEDTAREVARRDREWFERDYDNDDEE